MAEEALKNLEEQLKCSICHDTYTEPKLLQCFHVYCQHCLTNQQRPHGIICPTCRHVTSIPDRGVERLQPAFHINRLLDIQVSFQQLGKDATTAVAATSTRKNVVYCSQHTAEEVKLHCETCGELACYKCALNDGKHHDHDYDEIDKAFQKYTEEVTLSLDLMEKQVLTTKNVLFEVNRLHGKISNRRVSIEDKIHVTFARLQETIRAREIELVNKLDQMTQKTLRDLTTQRHQIETTLAQLSSCLDFMKESLRSGNEGDALLIKGDTLKQIEQVQDLEATPCSITTGKEAGLAFTASSEMLAMCRKYGKVVEIGLADPTQCHVQGMQIERAGERSTVTMQALDYVGSPCIDTTLLLDCDCVSEITGVVEKCSVRREEGGKYKISFKPSIKGRHHLSIRVDHRNIKGSPFGISLRSPKEKARSPIHTIWEVKGPSGVAINQNREILVSEWGENCVSLFSPSGEKLRSFGTHGSGQGQFRGPRRLTVDKEGNILVADWNNHRIQKFTSDGRFLTAVGSKGSGRLQFFYPADIAINPTNGRVYVMDRYNHRVQILNSDLSYFTSFGRKGRGEGQFKSPHGIACDTSGRVYVADNGNGCVLVFTAEGFFLMSFGHSKGVAKLFSPNFVTVDAEDTVYVSDSTAKVVTLFTLEGKYLTTISTQGHWSPHGVAVDESGVVYVCDGFNNSVHLF